MKVCTKCEVEKPLAEFTTRTDHHNPRRQCKTCRSEQRRARYAADPEHERHHSWRAQGIDVEEAKALFAAHDGLCGMCGSDKPKGMGTWHVDHDHKTGKLRGLLCFPCNILLGKVERLGLAVIEKYLSRHGGNVRTPEQ